MIDPLEIRLATADDVPRILEAFYALPDAFLYARSMRDLEAIRRHGQLVCTVEMSGARRVLTSSYIQPCCADDGDDAPRLGGGIAHPALRGSGIMRLIGALSIARWLRHHPGAVIESRVVAANPGPIRPLLASLGFVQRDALLFEDPALHGVGMRHWKPDVNGLVPVECWRSTSDTERSALARIAAFAGAIQQDGIAIACRISPDLLP